MSHEPWPPIGRRWGQFKPSQWGHFKPSFSTIAAVEQYGVSRLLDELAADLKDGRWRPLPARRVFIPKPGRRGAVVRSRSPLSATASCRRPPKTVIEPIFEADMLECSFGFRPRRSAHDALQVLVDEAWRGRRWVAESDIANCFEAIPHSGLMAAIEERISTATSSSSCARCCAPG